MAPEMWQMRYLRGENGLIIIKVHLFRVKNIYSYQSEMLKSDIPKRLSLNSYLWVAKIENRHHKKM